MDGLHLPKIVKLRELSDRCLSSANKNITTGEEIALTSRREKSSREKRFIAGEKPTRKKRTNVNDRQRKACSKKASSSTLGKSSLHDAKTQNTRRRFETIGLPKITTNIEENASQALQDGAKKARRTKPAKGDTISYVYSKSLQDENTMAFLRNSVDFEKDFNMNYNILDKRSSNGNKKPYGLPALKTSQELNEREELLDTEDFSEESLTETESLLNAWEAIDDDVSNGTTYDSTDCSTGNEV